MGEKAFTEKDMYNFIKEFSISVTLEDFRRALELAQTEINSFKEYRRGMFFKILLLKLNKDITWELAEHMEDKLVEKLV
jgi:hypothetical protein